MVDEKKVVASNYIINFYKDVNSLTAAYSNYQNDLITLKTKYGQVENELQEHISQEEKQAIFNNVSNIRYWCSKVYIQFQSIKDEIKVKNEISTKIDDNYKKIKGQFIINSELVEILTILFNKVIINSVIVKLLDSAEKFVGEIYGQPNIQQ